MFTELGIQHFQKELLRLIGPNRKPRSTSIRQTEPNSPMQTDSIDDLEVENQKDPNEKPGDKPRKRKPYRPGIGGFLVRSRNRFVSKKAGDENNGEKINSEKEGAAKKQARKKRSKISDNYPQYIQDAFFGSLSQEIKLPNPGPNIKIEPGLEPTQSPKSPSDFFMKAEPVDNSVMSECSDISGLNDFESEPVFNSIIDLDFNLPDRPDSENSDEDDFWGLEMGDEDMIGDLVSDGVNFHDIYKELEDTESTDETEIKPEVKLESQVTDVKTEAETKVI